MKKILLAAGICTIAFSSTAAFSMCQCECVNGVNRPMCTSAMDMAPMCPPMQCPMMAPSLAPLNPPTLPPIGTRSCRQMQIYNQYTRQYEWQQVCQ